MAIIQNQINREAKGLLSLFRAKVGGVTPQTLEKKVQPVVDVGPFLAGPILKVDQEFVIGNSCALNIVVPQDEVWLVYAASAATGIMIRAADSYGYLNLLTSVADADGSGLAAMQLADDHFEWNGAMVSHRQYMGAYWEPGQPMMFQPNNKFSCNGAHNATLTWTLSVLYSKLDV